MSKQDDLKNTDQTPPAAKMLQMLNGLLVTQLIYVAAKLGLADLLEHGPKSSDELASSVNAHPRSLYRLLRALASLGVFAETQDGRFELTSLAVLLQDGVPGSLRAYAVMRGEPWYWQAFGELLHSVRTGEIAFHHSHGMGHFEYFKQNDEAAALFNEAMTNLTKPHTTAIVTAYDFSSLATIVDVGGGQGSLLTAILRAYPQTHGILFDRPAVIKDARRSVKMKGLMNNCEFISGDFFKAVPSGGDAYILKSVIHDWDDNDATVILKNCRSVMANKAKLLLIEREVLPGNEPSPGKLVDITMLAISGGLERTVAEYESLLNESGFKLTRVVPTRSKMIVIEARPI
jgi:hypothetical protein